MAATACVNIIESGIRKLPTDLRAVGARWALVGGLAVSAHGGSRATSDLDIAVTTDASTEADGLVYRLKERGYEVATLLTDKESGELATVRLVSPVSRQSELMFDILFTTTGIEREIVAAAELLEPLPRLRLPVATRGHLLAMKLLSERETRLKDVLDIHTLLESATEDDLALVRESIALITERGYSRGKDLGARLEHFQALVRDG